VKSNYLKGTFLSAVLFLSLAGCNLKSGNIDKNASSVKENSIVTKEESNKTSNPTNVTMRQAAPDREKLSGRWVRSDGSYEIEIFSSTADGKLDAGYFNPNPIHVDKAEWTVKEDKLYMRIILKDINYPGSTYSLLYVPGTESLTGNYFQALEGINYDVVFTRKRK
jgi:hypothetical protein